jgi:hypothetical protein
VVILFNNLSNCYTFFQCDWLHCFTFLAAETRVLISVSLLVLVIIHVFNCSHSSKNAVLCYCGLITMSLIILSFVVSYAYCHLYILFGEKSIHILSLVFNSVICFYCCKSSCFYFTFLLGLEFELGASHLQSFYCLSHTSSPYCCGGFRRRKLWAGLKLWSSWLEPPSSSDYRCPAGFFWFLFIRQGFCGSSWPKLNSGSSCLCLLSAGITDVHHHAWLNWKVFLPEFNKVITKSDY